MNTIWSPGRCRTPRTGNRVVCGTSDTIDTFDPTRRFIRVDLPTLARPTSATNPQRDASAFTSGSGAVAIVEASSSSLTKQVLHMRRPRRGAGTEHRCRPCDLPGRLLSPGQPAPVEGHASEA